MIIWRSNLLIGLRRTGRHQVNLVTHVSEEKEKIKVLGFILVL